MMAAQKKKMVEFHRPQSFIWVSAGNGETRSTFGHIRGIQSIATKRSRNKERGTTTMKSERI